MRWKWGENIKWFEKPFFSTTTLCFPNYYISIYINKHTHTNLHTGFINFVTKPVFMLLANITTSVSEEEKPYLKCMDLNLKYWEERKIEIEKSPSVWEM